MHTKRCVTTGGHYAHLKIAEGCNKRCTYCIIPYIRGNYRSIPIEELVATARELVEGGVKELILVAQETTLYGTDLYGKKSLHLLPFYQRIQVDQQQNGSQDIPRHRQWYHSIVRMQEGSMLVHLDANLNDYPGFVKANQWE